MRERVLNKFYLTIVIALLAAAGSGFLYVALLQKTKNLSDRNDSARLQIALAESKRQSVYAARALFSDFAHEIARAKETLVKKDQPLDFIEGIERLARATINNMSLDIDNTVIKQNVLGFRITLEGVEKNTIKFLSLLELLPYRVGIREINFQRIAKDRVSGRLQFSRIVEENPDTRLFIKIEVETR